MLLKLNEDLVDFSLVQIFDLACLPDHARAFLIIGYLSDRFVNLWTASRKKRDKSFD